MDTNLWNDSHRFGYVITAIPPVKSNWKHKDILMPGYAGERKNARDPETGAEFRAVPPRWVENKPTGRTPPFGDGTASAGGTKEGSRRRDVVDARPWSGR